MTQRQHQNKLNTIKQQVDDPIIVPTDEEDDDFQTHFRYLDALTGGIGPFVSYLVELERRGVILPPAETLSDEDVAAKLNDIFLA